MLAWTDGEYAGSLSTSTSTDGISWAPTTQKLPFTVDSVSGSPGLAYSPRSGTTFLGWMTGSTKLNVVSTTSPTLDCSAWSSVLTTKLSKAQKYRLYGVSLAFIEPYLIAAWLGSDYRVTLTSSIDGGATWRLSVKLDEAFYGRPNLAVSAKGELVVTWSTLAEKMAMRRTCVDVHNLAFGDPEDCEFGKTKKSADVDWDGEGREWWVVRSKEKKTVQVAIRGNEGGSDGDGW